MVAKINVRIRVERRRFIECLLSSELLTWFARNLSAFYFKTGGGDHIIHLELGAREQSVCFV